MKKIIIISLLTIFFTLLPIDAAYAQPGPAPPANCNNYQILKNINSWRKNSGKLENTVGIQIGTIYDSLIVYWSYLYTAPKVVHGTTWMDNVSVFMVSNDTNQDACRVGKYFGKYYVLVTNDGKTKDIVFQPDPSDCSSSDYRLMDKDGKFLTSRPNCLATVDKGKIEDESKNPENEFRWFSKYLLVILGGVQTGIQIGTAPSPPNGTVDCATELSQLASNISDLRRLSYTFATNGCEEATLSKPCEPDPKKRIGLLFRGKDTGESIPDTMIAYQQALRELIQADPSGVVAALAKTYTIDDLIFTDLGIQRMKEIGDKSIAITNETKTLEANCKTYLDNYFKTKCVKISKYDPDPSKTEEICSWTKLKEIADKAIKIGQLVGQNPTSTVSGPLSGEGWVASAIKWIKCKVRNLFIVVLQFEANMMGWVLRRNY